MEHRNLYRKTVIKVSTRREGMAGGIKSLLGIGSAFDIWSKQDEEKRASVRCGLPAVFYMIPAYPA
jgi:hypothetical protein